MDDEIKIAVCRSCKEEGERKYLTKSTLSEGIIEITGEKTVQLLLLDKMWKSACSKLFDIRVFDEIRFPKGKFNEDFSIMYKLLLNSLKVKCHNDGFYHYI